MSTATRRLAISKSVWIVTAAAALFFAMALAHTRRSQRPPESSRQHPVAPEFSLTTIDGKKLSLSDFRGKVVLLDFWATWCTPCREEIPHFVELQQKYGPAGFQTIGISIDDSVEPVRQFYRDFHMNYPVALGGAKIGMLYGGVLGLPIAFVIDRDSRIVSKHVGASPATDWEREIVALLGQ